MLIRKNSRPAYLKTNEKQLQASCFCGQVKFTVTINQKPWRIVTVTFAFHVHYQESVHEMKDGLPKFKDLPIDAGGTGTELTE